MSDSQAWLITLEEHWLSKYVQEYYVKQGKPDPYSGPAFDNFRSVLKTVGEIRITDNEKGRVRLQVISHGPNTIPIDATTCIAANDELAQAISHHSERYRGFALLPIDDPAAAATELSRAVTQLGFVGAMIDNTTEGRFYDDEFFWPICAAAEKLDVPIYLHPSYNEQTAVILYKGNYSPVIARSLSTNGWGWHAECGTHFLRLYASGLFDKYPRFKLVLGHMGEMLPFQLDRVAHWVETMWREGPKRSLRSVWDENVWITTSGMFSLSPAACLLRQCKPDRICYSVDYPFASNEAGLKFMEELRTSGLVSVEQLEAIAYGNAAKLLNLELS
ncbi:uncharacterized protein Z520_11443 [Fonsecaea multimorphosa CBS 102226]|uniref:Amidohydrolase-related domain-containing protein n=1 Tax=Fonsecaea multimorphosa CBS 102226 TaxID=1442371 RepID=A0A0D2GTJ2_9EURO|nr:uncharacterized protein Z520_11443 [Fonsecaea multimorphosa CBS 102226]KIX92780.1 hypothetical protein Z520_11443 [Fonsecaea multimorphosa CBS 102226]OAL18028.1 hypothetical protein AYO22_11044 [Fonsecaea multimorphosa]